MTIDSVTAVRDREQAKVVARKAHAERLLLEDALRLMQDAYKYFPDGIAPNDIYLLAIGKGNGHKPAVLDGIERIYHRAIILTEDTVAFFGDTATLNYVVSVAEYRRSKDRLKIADVNQPSQN